MTPITPTTTPTPGAVLGFEATCGCGLRMAHVFEQSLRLDVAEHLAWHERSGR